MLKELKGLLLVTAFGEIEQNSLIFETYSGLTDQNMNYLPTTDFSREELDRYMALVDNIKSDSSIKEEAHAQSSSMFVVGMSIYLWELCLIVNS